MTDPCQIKQDTLLLAPAEQRSHADELTELRHIAVGRELHMMNLEKEVNELCQQRGDAARYPIELKQGTAAPKIKHQVAKAWGAAFGPSRSAHSLRQKDAVASRQTTKKLHAQVRESEERYRALFESINEGFCIIEKIEGKMGEPLDFRYIEANPAFAAHTGIYGVVGKTLRQVIPDEFEEWLLTYDTVCRTGEPIRFERGLVTQGRVLELHAFRVKDKARRRVGVSFKDITAQMRAEKLLRNNRDTFFNLIENAPFGLYIVDAQFCLRQVSAASQKVFSHVHPLIGRDFEEVLRLVWAEPFASEALGYFRHTLKTGEAYAAPNTTQQRNDVKDVESYDWKIERIVLPDGQFGVACYFYDVTERQRTQDVLRESEERYRNLFNSIDEGFCIIEMVFDESEQPVDYRFLEVNPMFEKQIGLRGVVGKRVRELVPDIEAFWIETYSKVALMGEPVRLTHQVKAMDILLDIYACRVGGSESRKVAVVFSNITERSRLERKTQEQANALIDLHRHKDEFLAMLSHELRNPLAPLSNAVHLLRLQNNEDPIQQQARGVIERQVGQLKHLVDDLLEVSRITTGKIQLRQEPIGLSDIVERAVETAQPLITQRRHQLTVTLSPQPIWLLADAARLEQVMVNLLTNAAKYTEEDGQLWLTVSQEGNTAIVRVRDTGVGIAPELLPCIFDLFTQATRSLDRSQGGLGIGLSLVRQLVELHGGTVEVNSVLWQGSEFVVRLPLMPASIPPLSLPSYETPQPLGKFSRVLVVDDNADAAQMLAMLLETSGHEVEMAYDGPNALKAALAFRPDVVLLDIGLPGLSGFEVAQQIRQQPALKGIVLVALTGYGHEADQRRSQEAGFDYHLIKPVDFDKVQKILASV